MKKKKEFSKKILIADYLIALLIVIFLIICSIKNYIYVSNIQKTIIETGCQISIIYPYDLTNLTKIIRALKALYAYTDGRTDEMEEALIKHCKGTEFFVTNIIDKTQAQIFDYLSEVVRYEMESPFTEKKKTTKKSSMTKAI